MILFTTILAIESQYHIGYSDKSNYQAALLALEGDLLGVDLNDDDTLLLETYKTWWNMVINTDWITDSNQNQRFLANAAGIVSGQNANSSTIAQDLNDQITKLNSQISDLNSQITSLKKQQSQKNADLEQARQDQIAAFNKADVF